MAVALVLAASCNKIDDKPVVPERTVINGVAEAVGSDTKAYNEYCYNVKWNEGDQIWVTDGTDGDMFTLTSGAGTTKGQFTEDGAKGITGDIEAFYPASLNTNDGYVWPAIQTNNQVAPMYAKQSISGTGDDVVSFSSLGAMLQIVFSTETKGITVTSITLKHNKKPLSGKFTVDGTGQAIMAENAENPGITLDLDDLSIGVAATNFYFAIPAGTYSTPEGDEVMTIIFTDNRHHKECVMTSTAFPEVKRNTVGRITLAKEFQDQKLTVRFDMNNSGLTGSFSTGPDDLENIQTGNTITAPAMPFAESYGFRGWFKEAACENAWNFTNDKVTGNMTLFAKWAEDPTEDKINGHEWVKLAGYYWATENISGDGPDYEPVTTDNTYGSYYAQADGYALNAARSWGSTWTLPSKEQWEALIANCDWKWTDNYNNTGKNGMVVTGKAENFEQGQSIFLPAAGYYSVGRGEFIGRGGNGYYWSTENVRHLGFKDGFLGMGYINNPGHGLAVRPVTD